MTEVFTATETIPADPATGGERSPTGSERVTGCPGSRRAARTVRPRWA